MSKFKYSTRLFKPYDACFMRLKAYRRYQKPIYKIVITNKNKRVIHTLGYYNPFKIKFRCSQRGTSKPLFTAKVIVIDRADALVWLRKGVSPSFLLCFLLEEMGLLKTHSLDNSSISKKFRKFDYEIRKMLPHFLEKLDARYGFEYE